MGANLGLIPTKKCVEEMRKAFPKGAEIELIYMDDPYREMPRGLKGRVDSVDDIGTIHAAWENGNSLGAVWDSDIVMNVETGIRSNAFWDDYRPISGI